MFKARFIQGQVAALQWTIDFSQIILAVYALAGAVTVLSLLLVLSVNLMRRSARLREVRLKVFRAAWSSILENDGPAGALPAVSPEELGTFITMWNRAYEASYRFTDETLANGAREHLQCVARRLQMERHAIALLRKRDIAMRLLAVEILGYLESVPAIPILRGFVDSPSAVISFAAARSLLQMKQGFADRFVLLMTQRQDWSPAKLQAVVQEEAASLACPIADMVRTSPPSIARDLVQYLRFFDRSIAMPVLRHVLQNVIDPGELAGALKVLAAIGTEADAPLAAGLASNADWRVRVQVANALGALRDASQIPVLTSLIDDTHWWVRYRAAQALASVSKEDEARLRTILKHITDRYGRDILTQIIAERESVFQRGTVS